MPPLPIRRALACLAILLATLCVWTAPASAAVTVHFQSFNGSVVGSRFPHTFVVFDGTLDSTGERIHSNFGFSARSLTPAILSGPVEHVMYVEKEKYVRSTNRHFSVTVSDATYYRMMQEVAAWRDAPGKYYDLNHRNCIHFVGRIAELAGLRVDFPQELLRKPRAWLNHIGDLNPQLGAHHIG